MAVRLITAYAGQAANTLYWGVDQDVLKATGIADDNIQIASDYGELARVVTTATAITTRNATLYRMLSPTAQTLTISPSGYLPVNSFLTVVQLGVGKTTLVGGTGVTLLNAGGLVTSGQYAVAQLLKIDPATWVAFGALGAS